MCARADKLVRATCRLGVPALLLTCLTAQEARAPAAESRDPGAVLQSLAEAAKGVSTVEDASWLFLAFDASGSTVERGPHRAVVRRLATVLRSAQNESSRFVEAGAPCSSLHQTLGSVALATLSAQTSNQSLRNLAKGPVRTCTSLYAAAKPSPDELALHAWLSTKLPSLPDAATAIAGTCRAHLADPVLRDDAVRTRAYAARYLTELLLGERRGLDAITAAKLRPRDPLADPLHTLYFLTALEHAGETTRNAESYQILSLIRSRQSAAPETWRGTAGLSAVSAAALLATCAALAEQGLTENKSRRKK